MNGPPDDTTPAEAIEDCAHVYVAEHQPGHSIYWLRFCMLCRKPDWDNVDEQVAEVTARAAATQLQRDIQLATEYNARYVVYECPQSTRVGRVPVEYPFADLLAEDTP